MKKFLCVLLMLCLLVPAALAEETALNWENIVPALEKANLTGEFHTFDEIAVKIWLPEGMLPVELTEEDKENGYIGYFMPEDQSAQMAVVYLDTNGMSLDEYIEEVRPDIEDSVVERLILQAIIKDQKIEVETSEYNSFISNYSNYYGMERDEIIEIFGGQRQMILSYAENKALEAVMGAADVTTKMPVPGSDNTDSSAPAEGE